MRLAEELFEVCRDYCATSWGRALDIAGVPVDSVWRQPKSIYYHPDIRVAPDATTSTADPAQETSEQPLAIQATNQG